MLEGLINGELQVSIFPLFFNNKFEYGDGYQDLESVQ